MKEENSKEIQVIIIGGGLSGIMAATKLCHEFLAKNPKNKGLSLNIRIVDPQEHLGGNTYNRYDVNVPMAQPLDELGFDDPTSFLRHMNRIVRDPQATDRTPEFWKKAAPQVAYDETINPDTGRQRGFDRKAFVTHNQYGHYVRTHLRSLRQWIEKENFPVTIETTPDLSDEPVEYDRVEAVDAWVESGIGKVKLADGRVLESDVVVLATGNVAPRQIKDINGRPLQGVPGYYNLDDEGLTRANVNEAPLTAFIGMANGAHFAVLSAIENGYKGKFLLCSVDGATPELRDTPHKKPYTCKMLTPETCEGMRRGGTLRADDFWNVFKSEVLEARKAGFSRHDVVDAVVPDFNRIWRMMNDEEKSAFRRKYGTEWGHMRYRMPDLHNEKIRKLYEEGRILYKEGLVREGANNGIRVDEEGGFWLQFRDKYGDIEEVHVPKVINNTGPSSRLADMSPLMRNLEKRGIISQHPLGGMRVDDDLRAIGSDDKTQNVFYAVGPIISGEFYEGVTIPAIRQCSEMLASSIVKDHVLQNAVDFEPRLLPLYDHAEGQINYRDRAAVQSGAGSVPSF